MADVTRRMTIVAGTSLIAALAASRGDATDSVYDPRQTAEGQIRMEACLDGHPAVWSYSGIIYAIQPGQHPRAILAIAGGSTSWASQQADGSWLMTGATMSFFRDPESGAFIETFDNPFTGRRVAVRPNILSGGGMHFPAGGGSARFVGRSRAGETTPGGFNIAKADQPLGRVEWNMTDDSVMLVTDHSFDVRVQPQLEARTIFADRKAFFDPAVRRLPARMATTTIVPWLAWMEMPDVPGHMIWHCSGEKFFDAKALPADYRARAGNLIGTLIERPVA